MGETTDQIEHHIEMKRRELRSNFTELAQKVKTATDWRQQFRNHTLSALAAAFAVGVLLSAMVGRSSTQIRASARRRTLATAALRALLRRS
jgi:hypothetical protein